VIQELGVFQGAPQSLYSERVTIAERQGASQNKNFEVKPTKKKSVFEELDLTNPTP